MGTPGNADNLSNRENEISESTTQNTTIKKTSRQIKSNLYTANKIL